MLSNVDSTLRNFLALGYDELETLNLSAKEKRLKRKTLDIEKLEAEYKKYLEKETRLKAVTVCFSDLEGRFQTLDYDKKFLLKASDNLTFDGSSIRGFSTVSESDLRLKLDWASFYWLPADVFGPGKVIVFADIIGKDGKPHPSDMRHQLKKLTDDLFEKQKIIVHASNEIEGFLVKGLDAEKQFDEERGFELVTPGGYYHNLPMDTLKKFIDATAEAQRAMGFENEKDHPEVAPSQFELNYMYTDVVNASDLVQIYKLTARQVAANMGLTATFLPKPMMGINGSGMHVNISLNKNGKNLIYDGKDKSCISKLGYDFIDRVLSSASDISLVLNSSVNAYRRLDPHFEAPNQIKFSDIDRTSMIRIPLGNEKSARLEIRSVGPDCNPYLLFYTLLKTGLEGPKQEIDETKRPRTRVLPGEIHDAIRQFKTSEFTTKILTEEVKEKYADLKQESADMCPRALGKKVKKSEIIYHHEVVNQWLRSQF